MRAASYELWLGDAKSSSQDGRLVETFGAPIAELYEAAQHPQASAALIRALELRSFLAVAEEQVARVRDRVHEATAADRDMGELSAGDLRMEPQWQEAALSTRDAHRAALGELLAVMPAPVTSGTRPVQFTQPKITTTLPPAVPAPSCAGAARARRA
ncbi:hypothetical protein [Streptomyces sp. NPDC059460]|uniref:hypothetical protein n=1 Tax=Streptomyces sp. NPDC059460 TaxID=3346840 RepID=UPI003692AB82